MKKYDVIVIGGGPGGFCAAAAAAKEGASVILVERYGFLGGMATAGVVNPFMGFKMDGKSIANPVFNDFIERMDAEEALTNNQHTFDDEVMKVVLDVMMKDYGVDVLFHAKFLSVEKEGDTITGLTVDLKEGTRKLEADFYIDSTGDGDVAASAGCRVEVGRSEDGLCQPMTLCFRLGGVELGDISYGEVRGMLNDVYLKAKDAGEVSCPRENILTFATLRPDVIHFNTTRVVKKSGISSVELTEAEIEARRQAYSLFKLFREKVPAFKNAFILKLATQIGIRETRRVMSSYAVGEDDVEQGLKHDDGIAKSTYPIDIHSPTGEGTDIRRVPEGTWYEIPYRCLVPEGADNLLVGGRCISSTHGGHSSLRVMPVVASIGEAAGIAAAWCVKDNVKPSEVDGTALKQKLLG